MSGVQKNFIELGQPNHTWGSEDVLFILRLFIDLLKPWIGIISFVYFIIKDYNFAYDKVIQGFIIFTPSIATFVITTALAYYSRKIVFWVPSITKLYHVQDEPPGNVQQQQPDNIQQEQPDNSQQVQSCNAQQEQPNNVQQEPPGNAQQEPSGNAQQEPPGNAQQEPSDNAQQEPPGNAQQNPAGNFQEEQTGNAQQEQTGNQDLSSVFQSGVSFINGLLLNAPFVIASALAYYFWKIVYWVVPSIRRPYPNVNYSNVQDEQPGNAQQEQTDSAQQEWTGSAQHEQTGNAQQEQLGNAQQEPPGNAQQEETGNPQQENTGNAQQGQTGNAQQEQLGNAQQAQTGNVQQKQLRNPQQENTANQNIYSVYKSGVSIINVLCYMFLCIPLTYTAVVFDRYHLTANMDKIKEKLSCSNPSTVQLQQPGNASQQQPGNASQQQPGNAPQQQPGNAQQEQPGNAQQEQPGNAQQKQPGNAQPEQTFPMEELARFVFIDAFSQTIPLLYLRIAILLEYIQQETTAERTFQYEQVVLILYHYAMFLYSLVQYDAMVYERDARRDSMRDSTVVRGPYWKQVKRLMLLLFSTTASVTALFLMVTLFHSFYKGYPTGTNRISLAIDLGLPFYLLNHLWILILINYLYLMMQRYKDIREQSYVSMFQYVFFVTIYGQLAPYFYNLLFDDENIAIDEKYRRRESEGAELPVPVNLSNNPTPNPTSTYITIEQQPNIPCNNNQSLPQETNVQAPYDLISHKIQYKRKKSGQIYKFYGISNVILLVLSVAIILLTDDFMWSVGSAELDVLIIVGIYSINIALLVCYWYVCVKSEITLNLQS